MKLFSPHRRKAFPFAATSPFEPKILLYAKRFSNSISPFPPAIDCLKQKIREFDQEEESLVDEATLVTSGPSDSDSALPASPIYDFIANDCPTFTNFTEGQLLDIWRSVDQRVLISRGRGPKPVVNSLDSLIVFLVHLKTNPTSKSWPSF